MHFCSNGDATAAARLFIYTRKISFKFPCGAVDGSFVQNTLTTSLKVKSPLSISLSNHSEILPNIWVTWYRVSLRFVTVQDNNINKKTAMHDQDFTWFVQDMDVGLTVPTVYSWGLYFNIIIAMWSTALHTIKSPSNLVIALCRHLLLQTHGIPHPLSTW